MLSSVLELLPNLKSTYFASMNPPNELALADMNKVCVLHVKRVIEPQRPLKIQTLTMNRLLFGYQYL